MTTLQRTERKIKTNILHSFVSANTITNNSAVLNLCQVLSNKAITIDTMQDKLYVLGDNTSKHTATVLIDHLLL